VLSEQQESHRPVLTVEVTPYEAALTLLAERKGILKDKDSGAENGGDPFLSTLPHTPRKVEERTAFPYYCPLCMQHYAAVYEVTCCKHYICATCAYTYIARTSCIIALSCCLLCFIITIFHLDAIRAGTIDPLLFLCCR
jgi:hypothetical protein